MKNLIKIIDVLDKLILLLANVNEENWKGSLINFRKSFSSIKNNQDFKLIKHDILRIYGGMGSFSDLVLYRDGQVLIKENKSIHLMRNDLFKLLNDN